MAQEVAMANGAGKGAQVVRSLGGLGAGGSIFDDDLVEGRLKHMLEGREKELGELIVQCVLVGLGLQFSPTRLGSALAILVWEGDRSMKAYAANEEELGARLGAIRRRVKQLEGAGAREGLTR
jgi:hypothetical protein